MSVEQSQIHMQRLMLRYPSGKIALSGVTLDIQQGQFVYLVGESGAGKSSLLRMFYGGIRPSSGTLMVQG
ncbi:ATP-binding cassette domain-containing protein, partial [Mariprofundus ferrooxydans]|nr:ATP-binding cassette domain-containing protein [Mariprofundus ferrooxydans]